MQWCNLILSTAFSRCQQKQRNNETKENKERTTNNGHPWLLSSLSIDTRRYIPLWMPNKLMNKSWRLDNKVVVKALWWAALRRPTRHECQNVSVVFSGRPKRYLKKHNMTHKTTRCSIVFRDTNEWKAATATNKHTKNQETHMCESIKFDYLRSTSTTMDTSWCEKKL